MIASYQLVPKYFLGKDCLKELINILNNNDKYHNVLILYGGSSIHKNGVYDQITSILKSVNHIKVFEFNGIEPNPRCTTIDKAVDYCRKNNIDLILAVGGGSVIDASKVIGVLTSNKDINTSWEYVLDSSIAKKPSIDIFSILTIAGTGSENNSGSVITNWQENAKVAVFSPTVIPKYTFLDPTFTNSLPIWQLSSGIFDCFSHLLEQYYGKQTFKWTEEIILANLKTLLSVIDVLYKQDLYDYEARKNLMWTASMSLNSTTSFASDADWNVHAIEHAISAKWDITHGAGLALITPYYINVRSANEEWFKNKTIKLAKQLFNVDSVQEFINKLKSIITLLKLPLKYNEFDSLKNISDNDLEFIIDHSVKYGSTLDKQTISKVVLDIFK